MADHVLTLADFEAQAFAAGTKTQLRRPIAVTLHSGINPRFSQLCAHPEGDGWRIHGSEEASDRFTVPYALGDRLWVQEAWQVARETVDYETGGEYDVFDWDEDMMGDPRPYLNGCARYGTKAGLFYRADGEDENPGVFYPLIGVRDEVLREAEIDWRPAEDMPRWASRLTLEVIGVRVERLTDITDGDALDEGVSRWVVPAHGPHSERGKPPLGPSPRTRFANFWDAIHGTGAFAQAPWVVALTLRVIPQDGDASAQAA